MTYQLMIAVDADPSCEIFDSEAFLELDYDDNRSFCYYNGARIALTNECHHWMVENIDNWTTSLIKYNGITITFSNDNDAALFSLRWLK